MVIVESHLSDNPKPIISGTTTHECWESAGITFCHACLQNEVGTNLVLYLGPEGLPMQEKKNPGR